MKIYITLFALFVGATLADFVNYKGYKVYQTHPNNEEDLKLLQVLEGDDYDFWTQARSLGETVDVMVAPKVQEYFESLLKAHEIEFTYLHEDLESDIAEEREELEVRRRSRGLNSRIEFNQYYRFAEINEYLHSLELSYPALVTLEDIGTSLEGREMIVAKISTGVGSTGQKPTIIIDGGIHAREWISPATVTYIIEQLVTNTSNFYLIENVDWYILPVLNPDGYEYSHETARLWRKTRSNGFFCWGTDANRNYDFYWGTVGASTQECSETYRGPSPASEKETIVYSTFVEKYAAQTDLYLSFHSYGNYFLYPWGYINQAAPNGAVQDALAQNAAAAIRAAGGPVYTVGPSATTLYATSGSSVDWAYGAVGIPLSLTVELPQNSFIVPPENIFGIVTQTFEGVRVFGEYVRAGNARK